MTFKHWAAEARRIMTDLRVRRQLSQVRLRREWREGLTPAEAVYLNYYPPMKQ